MALRPWLCIDALAPGKSCLAFIVKIRDIQSQFCNGEALLIIISQVVMERCATLLYEDNGLATVTALYISAGPRPPRPLNYLRSVTLVIYPFWDTFIFNMQIKHICLLVFSVARVVAFEPAPIRNFTQKLNHNQTSGETFQQQYQIDTTKFKTGRPIIFLQGAEDAKPLSPEKLYTNVVADHAAQLNGIVATLEHRYFGYSFPKGFNGSIGSYSALTLDNVLQDSVEFVKYIKAQVPGAENSTVLVAGGRILT